jgi:hypothetical protein
MAKKKDTEEVEVREEASPPPLPPPPAPPPEPVMSFDRYFQTTGRPFHHKAGLLAYLQAAGSGTGGKRTKNQWDAIFAQY